jgi:polyhydroxybutyrate depolymerase
MGRRSSIAGLIVVAVLAVAACVPPPGTTDPPPGATGPSPGCGTTTQGPVTDEARTVSVGNGSRRYTLTVPPQHVAGTTAALPLVLDFHGLIEGSVGTHPLATQFSAKAIDEGFVVAYPIGSNDGFYWEVAQEESNPDLRFVDALIAELGDTMCIDRSRLYVTGLSYGAAMTSMLMCMRPNTFAAAAPVAGLRNTCTATERKIPFVTFHGTADWILPYQFFGDTPQAIATKYGCETTPSESTVQPDPDPGTGASITHLVWNCDGVGSAAEFYRIDNGGHSWPGSWFFSLIGFIVGPTTTAFDATDVIWDFFTRFHL